MLCSKLYSVKGTPVVTALFRNHLLRGVRGNTCKRYKQNFRCTKCNAVYVVLPLDGMCKACSTPVNFTVHIASANKYSKLTRQLLARVQHQISPTLRDQVHVTLAELQRLTLSQINTKPRSVVAQLRVTKKTFAVSFFF